MGLGIQHIYTSPYYPNPSHAERVNKQIKIAIRIFHHQHQKHWDQDLHWFQIAFNSAQHESTKVSPARLFLGRNLYHPLELHWNLDKLVDEHASPQSSREEWERAVQNLTKARQRRQQGYDLNRLPNPYKTGDWVMFKEHHLSKAADSINQKLLPVWSKPCVIETFSSPVTARLINPSTAQTKIGLRDPHQSSLGYPAPIVGQIHNAPDRSQPTPSVIGPPPCYLPFTTLK
ncbi:uncharacterized protein LOC129000338 [Macrosteles quadrilineatus]|uniref:uncharacterized protein LOC129000338 n=1 Tax=Macrosteles quadrilineatus TaxID=74068 RepID=UPI0023E2A36F|nr:uncharacterized protein LOC129000338 [Macrosteles quadrilineatus]